jgi:molecular chaperone HscB
MSNDNKVNANHYFALLGLPLSFNVDKDSLMKHYHELQKSVHPDNFASHGELERRLSVQKAAQINDALQTLKNPLRRSIYLLSLYGIELGENNSNMDPAFLMEQMELREKLAEVGAKDDPLEALDNIMDDVKSRINQLYSTLEKQFEQILASDDSSDVKKLTEAKSQVLKLQFLNRLQEECLSKEEELTEHL